MKTRTIISILSLLVLLAIGLSAHVLASDSPIVNLISPGWQEVVSDYPKRDSVGTPFFFNVSSANPIDRCYLYIDDKFHSTIHGVKNDGSPAVVAVDLNSGVHIAKIDCSDSTGAVGSSKTNLFYVCKSKGACRKF